MLVASRISSAFCPFPPAGVPASWSPESPLPDSAWKAACSGSSPALAPGSGVVEELGATLGVAEVAPALGDATSAPADGSACAGAVEADAPGSALGSAWTAPGTSGMSSPPSLRSRKSLSATFQWVSR